MTMSTPEHAAATKRTSRTRIWNMHRRRLSARIEWDEEGADGDPAEETENTLENDDGN